MSVPLDMASLIGLVRLEHMPGPLALASGAAVLFLVYLVCHGVYNVYFHPLHEFPGPWLDRAFVLPSVIRVGRGYMHHDLLAMHKKYGPVVRISPTQLAFFHPDSWRDIYGRRTDLVAAAPGGPLEGLDELPKDPIFFDIAGTDPSILSETRFHHARLRRLLGPAFAGERALREQAPIVAGHVDELMAQLRRISREGGPEAKADMAEWYHWATMDIMGTLSVGQTLNCLASAGKACHPWVAAFDATLEASAMMFMINLFGIPGMLGPLMPVLMRLVLQLAPIGSQIGLHMQLCKDKMQELARLGDRTAGGPTLIGALLTGSSSAEDEKTEKDEKEVAGKEDWLTPGRLGANAGLLLIAGSETTATTLAGTTYLLSRHQDKQRRLAQEIRSSFASEEDITLVSVGRLPYLQAVLEEALRTYPPVAGQLARCVPQGGAVICGFFVPEKTSVSCWQWPMYHSPHNVDDPFAFKPERYLEEGRSPKDHLEAIQPFSLGPRNCIGRNFAFAEMRYILARLLFEFDLELAEPAVDWLDQTTITLWYKLPLPVHLKPVRQ